MPQAVPMRVALFTDTYPPQVNGVSRTLSRLTLHLLERGHRVALVTPAATAEHRNGRPAIPEVELHVTLGGVPVPVYPELLLTRTPRRADRDRLEAFDPRVVHCATESVLGWWGRRWALRTGRPLITSFHTNFPTYAAGYGLGVTEPLAWSLLRRFHAPALHTLCPSRATHADLVERGFHPRLRIWPRGVDADVFSPEYRSLQTRQELAPGAQVILLYVGRLAPEKRLPLLLEAFRDLRSRAPVEVRLLLVGGGPMEAEIRKGGHPGVELVGYLEGDALSRVYASSDIFAFPSDTETFGNVVLEAMASGLPVVGVDRGGVKDLIFDGSTGFRTPPGQVEPFANALLRLVEDPFRRADMSRRAREEAERRSWPAILDGVIDTYREVAA